MDALMPDVLSGVSHAAKLWLYLIAGAVAATGLAMTSQWRPRERVLRWWVRRGAARLRVRDRIVRATALQARAADAADLVELADAVVEDRLRRWFLARDAARSAWQAAAATRPVADRDAAATAVALPRPSRARVAVAGRRAWLHRAALRALARGHLSHPQLLTIRAGRHGFDPRRHPADLEIQLHRAVRRHLFDVYRAAAMAERAAWHAADTAVATRNDLRRIAGRATLAAIAARASAANVRETSTVRSGPAGWPRSPVWAALPIGRAQPR